MSILSIDRRASSDINWINVCKALCMIFIYFIHCQSYYGVWFEHINSIIHPIYVNAFFFVSGYLLFRKHLSIPAINESLHTFFSKRGTGTKTLLNILFRMLIPCFLFACVEYLPKIYIKKEVGGLYDFINDTIGGGHLLVCKCTNRL